VLDAGELDGQEGIALVVRGLLHGGDPPRDWSTLAEDGEVSRMMSEARTPLKVSPCWVVALSSV